MYERYIKRLLDIILSLTATIILSIPIMPFRSLSTRESVFSSGSSTLTWLTSQSA